MPIQIPPKPLVVRSLTTRYLLRRTMSTKASGIPHEDRTAAEPRSSALHAVTIHKITSVNPDIKLYKLRIKDAKHGVKVSI